MMFLEVWGTTYVIHKPRKVPKVYLRYGLYQGRSHNWNTREDEQGLSVYNAVLKDGVVYLDAETCPSLIGQGRLVLPVTGEEVGGFTAALFVRVIEHSRHALANFANATHLRRLTRSVSSSTIFPVREAERKPKTRPDGALVLGLGCLE